MMPSPEPTGEIHFFADHVLPEAINGIDIIFLPCQRRHIGHSAVHVGCPHGMADRFGLFCDRLMILPILSIDAIFFTTFRDAPMIEKELR